MPSLAAIRSQAAAASDATTAAHNLVAAVMAPWQKERPDALGATFADRLTAHLLQLLATAPSFEEGVLLWLGVRLLTADAASVSSYLIRVRSRVMRLTGKDPSQPPAVRLFIKRIMALRGSHRQAFRPALLSADVTAFLATEEVPLALRVVVCLAWRRAARIADILETRQGGLWTRGGQLADHQEVWLEQPFAKMDAAGSFDRVLISLSLSEISLVQRLIPLLSDQPPLLPPHRRHRLFPAVTTAMVASHLDEFFGRRVGAHSVRRGAMRSLLEACVSLPEVMLLSLHRSTVGAVAYTMAPDAAIAARTAAISRSL